MTRDEEFALILRLLEPALAISWLCDDSFPCGIVEPARWRHLVHRIGGTGLEPQECQ
jgi:hypothetical protein